MSDDRASLTGVWNGLYSYAAAHPESSFTAVLIDSGGALSGMIHETMQRQGWPSVETNAAVEGAIAGDEVRFIKTYDGSGGQQHSIAYDGHLNADASEIEGVWTIRLPMVKAHGRFLMIRAQRETIAGEIRREANV